MVKLAAGKCAVARWRKRLPLVLLLAGFCSADLYAEILNDNTPLLRIRVGSNTMGATETVIYNAGVPSSMGGLPGVTAAPTAVSTNAVAGGSGIYTVRFVTDVNAKGAVAAPLTGTFRMDSSGGLSCVTPATCGASSINFDRIGWNTLYSDTLNAVTQYNGTAAQLFWQQTDTDPRNSFLGTRHRNYFQFFYTNDQLVPAGTYEGTVTYDGEAN